MLSKLNRYAVPLVILLLVLAELVINPIGEFPLNDDWAFSRVIYNYIHTGVFKFSDWQSLPLVPQLFTGIVATKIFGFSFTVLRFISLISLAITIIFLNKILCAFNTTHQIRIITLLLFTFNPLTISLANTFLPDVFTLMLVVIALYYMFALLKEYKMTHFILFCLFTLLATTNRQTSIVLPIVSALLYITRNPISVKTIATSTVPIAFCIVSLIAFPIICSQLHMLPVNYGLQLPHIIDSITHPTFSIIESFGYYFITATLLLGIFMLPFTLANYKEHLAILKDSTLLKISLLIYVAVILLKTLYFHNYLPFAGNMFYPHGVGPIIMTGLETQYIHPVSITAKTLWTVLDLAGGISFLFAFSSLFTKQNKNTISSLLLLILFASYLIPLCFSYVNDRYLLLLLPFFFLAYLQSIEFKANKFLLILCVITTIGISTVTTHDYISINRARWKATNELVNTQHISPTSIDGGFEFNGWYSNGFENYNPLHIGRWWWVNDDTYIISSTLISGYKVQETIPFSSFISFSFHNLYILKRN